MAEAIITEEQKEALKIKGMNIYEKMSMITDELGVVAKNLKVEVTKTSSYKAVSERDVLDAVKPIEKKYRVYSYPYERSIVEKDIITKETQYGTSNQFYIKLDTIYRFVNIDNPEEFIDIRTYGDGIDSGDKSSGKAMTYADKYALMKGYKISTGDDPDKEASPEKGYTKKESKPKEKLDTEVDFIIDKNYNEALKMSGQNEQELLDYFEVKKRDDLTNEQKQYAINVMNVKIKKAKNILDEASEQLKEEGLE